MVKINSLELPESKRYKLSVSDETKKVEEETNIMEEKLKETLPKTDSSNKEEDLGENGIEEKHED